MSIAHGIKLPSAPIKSSQLTGSCLVCSPDLAILVNPYHCKGLLCNLFEPFRAGLQVEGTYRPRFELDYNSVVRIPVVPGADPRKLYGDVAGRGVKVCKLRLPVSGPAP